MENYLPSQSSKKPKYSDRVGWISPSFEASVSEIKKRKPRNYNKPRNYSKKNYHNYRKPLNAGSNDDVTWAELFGPQTKEDLGVHKKKISEVEEWLIQSFESCRSGITQQSSFLLLLTGPAGSGKTATIKALARELDADICEWSSAPHETSSYILPVDGKRVSQNELSTIPQTQAAVFRDFFVRANKYSSVLSTKCNRLILVEEYPNVFLKDPIQFHNIIRVHHKTARCPAVFIVSDCTSGESLENRLFPREIQAELKITNISFNPVASTMLMKSIERICQLQGSDLSKEELEGIASDSMGDIRSAINTLQFLSTCSCRNLNRSILSGKEKKSEFNSGKEDISISARDSSLFLFHALGKILYSKRDVTKETDKDMLPPHLIHMQRFPLISNPEEVFGKTSMSAEGFSLYLHENYLSFVDDVDVASLCLSSFSQADALCTEWAGRDVLSEYAASLVTRGLMFNMKPTSSGKRWCPLRKPQYFSYMKNYRSSCSSLRNTFRETKLNLKELQTELVPYLSKIGIGSQNLEQTQAIKQFGQMALKTVHRPLFESLTAKDVIKDELDNVEENFPSNTETADAINCYFANSEDEVLIEDYDDE